MPCFWMKGWNFEWISVISKFSNIFHTIQTRSHWDSSGSARRSNNMWRNESKVFFLEKQVKLFRTFGAGGKKQQDWFTWPCIKMYYRYNNQNSRIHFNSAVPTLGSAVYNPQNRNVLETKVYISFLMHAH